MGNWVVLIAAGGGTFVALSRLRDWRETVATGLFVLSLCAILAPVWMFLFPAMGGATDAFVGVLRFGIFGAVAGIVAVVCAGLGYLIRSAD